MTIVLAHKYLERLSVDEVLEQTTKQGSYLEVHAAGDHLIGLLVREEDKANELQSSGPIG